MLSLQKKKEKKSDTCIIDLADFGKNFPICETDRVEESLLF
jgi:hypothetical protein